MTVRARAETDLVHFVDCRGYRPYLFGRNTANLKYSVEDLSVVNLKKEV
jgi:hypothetical protein